MGFLLYFFAVLQPPTSRFSFACASPHTERALWQEEESLAGKLRLEAGVFTPSRPDLGGPEKGCGLVEERGLLGPGIDPSRGRR